MENPGVGSLMLPKSNILTGAGKPMPAAIQEKFTPERLRHHAVTLTRPPAHGTPELLAVI